MHNCPVDAPRLEGNDEMKHTDFQYIARDLEFCELGLALTTGPVRRQYAKHRKACYAAIKAANKADGLDGMSDDELLAELTT